MSSNNIGAITWFDLTVPDADKIRDFYKAVVGWDHSPVDMGGYSDYNMMRQGSDLPAAGICHARGINSALPPVWMVYITVEDMAKSLEEVKQLGGKIIDIKPEAENPQMVVIQDPSGAVCTLFKAQS